MVDGFAFLAATQLRTAGSVHACIVDANDFLEFRGEGFERTAIG